MCARSQSRFRPDHGVMLALAVAVTVLPSAAHAHVGNHDAASFASGLVHPFTGMDHMLAMLAVGMLASILGRRSRWALPAACLAAMSAGGLAGSLVNVVPITEAGIAASLIVFGLLLASRLEPHLNLAASIVAAFAVFHGLAHGQEMPATASACAYGLGFLVATALLHTAGVMAGDLVSRLEARPAAALQRACGAIVAVAGVGAVLGGF